MLSLPQGDTGSRFGASSRVTSSGAAGDTGTGRGRPSAAVGILVFSTMPPWGPSIDPGAGVRTVNLFEPSHFLKSPLGFVKTGSYSVV